MPDRLEDLPETFNQMMRLPHVPDFSPSPRDLTEVHQIKTARGALLKKEERHRTKGWTVALYSTRRDINAPLRIMQHQAFFPLRGILLVTTNRKGIMAFACNEDFGKSYTMQPFSQRLRDKPGVHGQGNLRELKTLTITYSFQTC
jgi:hypothetical protein